MAPVEGVLPEAGSREGGSQKAGLAQQSVQVQWVPLAQVAIRQEWRVLRLEETDARLRALCRVTVRQAPTPARMEWWTTNCRAGRLGMWCEVCLNSRLESDLPHQQ